MRGRKRHRKKAAKKLLARVKRGVSEFLDDMVANGWIVAFQDKTHDSDIMRELLEYDPPPADWDDPPGFAEFYKWSSGE
jgi:hypothetical protein